MIKQKRGKLGMGEFMRVLGAKVEKTNEMEHLVKTG